MSQAGFFRDKVVVVTGSSRGIGFEIARQILAEGGKVVLHGRSLERLQVTQTTLGFAERTLLVAADLSQPEGAETLVDAALSGLGRIDVLINNAGLSMRGDFIDLRATTVRTMVDANFLSAVWTTLTALPTLRATRGRVAFVSSMAALRGFPGVSLYSAAKMALTALDQSLHLEEGRRGVGFTLALLPFTQNDPEKTVLTAEGKLVRHQRPWQLTQAKAASGILQAVARGKRRKSFTVNGRILEVAQAIFPGVVEAILAARKTKVHDIRRSSS